MKDLKDTKALQDSQEMLILDQELLKRDVKALTAALQDSRAEIKADLGATQMEIKTQLAALMEMIKQGNGTMGNNGNGNNGQGHGDTGAMEEKDAAETAVVATPARQNLGFIYGTKTTHPSAAGVPRTDSQLPPGNGGNAGGGAVGGGAGGGGLAAEGGAADGSLSEADQLRQRLSSEAGQLSAGEITPTGDPFRALREQFKGKNAPHGRVLTAALRAAASHLGVSGQTNDLISLGAQAFIIMLIQKKLLESFQSKDTTVAEDKIVVRMQKLQEKDKIDVRSGRQPLRGWPSDLFQKPAAEIPNIIHAVKMINGVFRMLHATLCSMNNGNALETAMGVGDVEDKFIAPGANITIMEKLYKVALGSIDSSVTVPGVVQNLRDFWAEYAYKPTDVPSELLHSMYEAVSELGRKVQLIGDLGVPCVRKAELVTGPGDVRTWFAYGKSVAMAVNNGVESMTVVTVFEKLELKFEDMMKDKEDLDIYELATMFSLLAQACQNIESTALSGLNKMLKGKGPAKFESLVSTRSGKVGNPGGDGKKNQGLENKKRKQSEYTPRGEEHEGGGGFSGGTTGGNGNGGKQTTAGCYLSVKSERPWGNDVFAAKDALAEIARTAGVLGPRDKFNGYLVKDSADPTIYSIKFPDPEMTQKMQRAIDGSTLDGVSLKAAVSTARSNRARANVWVRRAIFDAGDDNDDAMSIASSLSDNMSTASGYSSAMEQATARRATGSVAGGVASGGASRSAPGVVLSADQSEELRDVLNATTETRGVQLVQQPNGGVGVAQSLGANSATADP